MNSSEIDSRLQEYTAAEHRIGSNLAELETHAVYQLLTSGVLKGQTAKALSAFTTAEPTIWELFSILGTTLEKARSIRGTSSRISGENQRSLTQLLTTPSIVIREFTVPLAERSLTSETDQVERSTLAGLIERMRTLYEPLRDAIAQADEVLDGLLPRLAAADQTIADLRETSRQLNLDEIELNAIAETIETIRDLSLTDPLAIPTTAKSALEGALHDAGASIATARSRHDAIANDLTIAADLLDRCRSLIARATADRARAHQKVVIDTSLPLVPNTNAVDGPRGLAAALKPIGTADEPWQQTRRELDSWLTRARRFETQLSSVAARIRTPLDNRDELRGRLRAIRAKMSGVGRSEDPALSELSQEVHNELYTAPTDLARAERLLGEFLAKMQS